MARGLPAVWSTIVGLPFLLVGVYLFAMQSVYPSQTGIPAIVFGAFIILLGLYVQFIAAPREPKMRQGEELIDTRGPAQRSAIVMSFVGLAFLLAGIYLLYFSGMPLVYPTVALVIGLFLFTRGVYTYWKNSLTTYYVTNQRVIKEYRFLSLLRTEIPFDAVRSVQEQKSIVETLVGLGNVMVRSGGGTGMQVKIKNIYRSAEFANAIRQQMGPGAAYGAGPGGGQQQPPQGGYQQQQPQGGQQQPPRGGQPQGGQQQPPQGGQPQPPQGGQQQPPPDDQYQGQGGGQYEQGDDRQRR